MRAAYVKAPFQFQIREMPVREISEEELLVRVRACGICGTDLHTAATEAKDWQPFGHEIAGVVEKVGRRVANVRPGQSVVLESGTFDRYSDQARNGRVDLDNRGPNFWLSGPMGFAEYIVVPREVAVPFSGLSFEEAALVEPLGVALDLAYTAEIRLNDDVLVVGLGPIGLMCLQLARAMGARRVYAAQPSRSRRRVQLGEQLGADRVILTDQTDIREIPFERGGVDRVLVTAPPSTIPAALEVAAPGGVVAFIGIEYGPGAVIGFDANAFHFKKLQLRASFASPALYFPRCLELIRCGRVDVRCLISSTFPLEEIGKATRALVEDKAHAVKSVMVAE
jgi:L-iditol 2-dehydrogenase